MIKNMKDLIIVGNLDVHKEEVLNLYLDRKYEKYLKLNRE